MHHNWTTDTSSSCPPHVQHGEPAPTTVIQVFQDRVKATPDRVALRQGTWCVTWRDYYDLSLQCAKSFVALGLNPHRAVVILAHNSVEWFALYNGCLMAGGCPCGIYFTSPPSQCQYLTSMASADFVVLGSSNDTAKFAGIHEKLPGVKKFIQLWHSDESFGNRSLSWDAFLQCGIGVPFSELEASIERLEPGSCASLVFTSGTTSKPKCCMISHDNLTFATLELSKIVMLQGTEVFLSYLPLSHIGGLLMDLHVPLRFGCQVVFAGPDALRGPALVDYLKDARPTYFMAPPRFWEKMYQKMRERSGTAAWWMKLIGRWAKGLGTEVHRRRLESGSESVSLPWAWSIADKLVFSRVKTQLGLDRCRFQATGAAPMSPELHTLFASLNLPVAESYGCSECCGMLTVSTPWRMAIGAVGVPMSGVPIRIVPLREGDEEGEVVAKGRTVFMGYKDDVPATMAAFDDDGWYHTGDVGRMNADGFLFISGRIRNIIVTSGGENIAPAPIEFAVKHELDDLIGTVVVIGDGKPYLTCLVALQCRMDLTTYAPTDMLDADLAARLHLETVSQARQHPDVLRAIRSGIERANTAAPSRAAKIRRFFVLERDFSLDAGEMTVTMKLKREVINHKFRDLVQRLYQDQPGPDVIDIDTPCAPSSSAGAPPPPKRPTKSRIPLKIAAIAALLAIVVNYPSLALAAVVWICWKLVWVVWVHVLAARLHPLDPRRFGAWALVTGASDGIGAAMAIELARRGVNVVLLGRNEAKLRAVEEQIRYDVRSASSRTRLCVVDLSRRDESVFDSIALAIEGIEIGILVNNAGVCQHHPDYLCTLDASEVQTMLDVNVVAPIRLTRMLAPGMMSRQNGAIVNVSSGICWARPELFSVYAATKSALTTWSLSMYRELSEWSIHVEALIPGHVSTKMCVLMLRATDSGCSGQDSAFRGWCHRPRISRALLSTILAAAANSRFRGGATRLSCGSCAPFLPF